MRARRVMSIGWFATAAAIVAAVTVSILLGGARGSSLPWEPDLDRALARAKTENKPVMVDFRADWCSWCFKLEETTYRDSRVRDLAKRFVCVQVDVDRNPDLAARYNVMSLPVILFLRPDGRLKLGLNGYFGPDGMARAMRTVLDGS